MAKAYGKRPAWHDVQAAITGPAVYDVETVFRERWQDPTPLSRHPVHRLRDRLAGIDTRPDALPEQAPTPEPVPGGTHIVQLLRNKVVLRSTHRRERCRLALWRTRSRRAVGDGYPLLAQLVPTFHALEIGGF